MKKAHNFRELIIWKEAMDLVKDVYTLTSKLPASEQFGIISQIQRCAVSIPSNIAEGSGRGSEQDFIRFLRISLSSSYELETQTILLQNLFSIDSNELMEKISILQLKIGAFIRKLTSDLNDLS